MNAFWILLAMYSVWSFNLGHCALLPMETEVSMKSNNIDINSTQCPFSPHFRKIVMGIYKQNPDNFNELLHLSEISVDINFKADVLLGLNDAINKVPNSVTPFRAMELYNKIEALVNVNSTNLYADKLNELKLVQNGLLIDTIVPKGSRILESVAYVKGCSIQETPVEKMMNMLLTTNEKVSNLTFGEMIRNVRIILPVKDLAPILADLSLNVEQNVDLLLTLYDENSLQEAEKNLILPHFLQLTTKSDYSEIVSAEKQLKINALIPLELQLKNLVKGKICLYQELADGNRRYIYECSDYYQICSFESQNSKRESVFQVEVEQMPFTFRFISPYYSNRAMCIKPIELESSQSKVYSSKDYADIYWKVQLKDNQVVLQSMNSSKYLCAGSAEQDFAYTLLLDEQCKWFVEDCNEYVFN